MHPALGFPPFSFNFAKSAMAEAPRPKRKWDFKDIVLSAPPPEREVSDAEEPAPADKTYPASESVDLRAPPQDWSLKTKLQIRSSKSFAWARTMAPASDGSGLARRLSAARAEVISQFKFNKKASA
eukprot:scaffold259_cov252-Pinguiococcus_pyrenoidosus.AAC.7